MVVRKLLAYFQYLMLVAAALNMLSGCSIAEDWVKGVKHTKPAGPLGPQLTDLSNKTYPSNYVSIDQTISLNVDNTQTGNDQGMTYSCEFDLVADGTVSSGTPCTSLNATASFDSSTGVLSWVPSFQNVGAYEILFKGTNSNGSDTEIVVIHVKAPFVALNLVAYLDASMASGVGPGFDSPFTSTWKDLWGSSHGPLLNIAPPSSYEDEVQFDTPLLNWKFDETTGTVAEDSSLSNLDGTYTNSPSLDVEGVMINDTPKKAVKFDGVNDYAIATVSGTTLTQLTVEFWLKPSVLSGTPGVFQWASALTATTPFILFRQVGSTLRGYVDGNYYLTNASINLSTQEWTHVGLTLTTSNLWTLYVNGEVHSSYQDDATHTHQLNAQNIYVGNGYSGYFNGAVDELSVYQTSLSASRIKAHFSAGFSGWKGSGSQAAPFRLSFDGIDDSVDLGTGFNSPSSVTVETWISPLSAFRSGKVIFANGDSSSRGMVVKQSGGSGRLQIALGSNATYVDEVMADSPFGYWRLGEANGTTAFDSSANPISGTYSTGVLLGQAHTPSWGDPDTNAYFNATTHYIDIPKPLDTTGTLTIEAWVRADSTDARTLNYPVSGFSAGALKWGASVGGTFVPSKMMLFFNGASVSNTAINTFEDATDQGQWRHIVYVYDKNATPKTKFYKDATLIATDADPIAGDLAAIDTIRIGTRSDAPGLYFPGNIDEVAIYATALSAPRITAHYNARTRPACQSQSNLTNDLWHHIAGVFDSSGPTLKLMVNGSQECIVTGGGSTYSGSTASFQLGSSGSGTYWHGGMAEMRFHSSALSTVDTRTNVTSTWAKYTDFPKSISGLQLWLKAEALTGNNNDPITTWSDSSGNANNATSLPTQEPLLITNALNGRPVLRFDGLNDYMTIAHSSTTAFDGAHSVFLVMKASYVGNTVIMEKGGNIKLMIQPDAGGLHYLRAGTTSGAIQSDIMNGAFNVLAMTLDTVGPTRTLYLNGAYKTASATTNPASAASLVIGSRSGVYPQPMDLAEVIIYDRLLTDTERRRVEAYLNVKYNLN